MRGTVVQGRRRNVCAGLVTMLLLGACVMPGGMSIPTGTQSPDAGAGVSATTVARGVIAEVNSTRLGQGLDALIEDAVLNRAAREHSEELAARGKLDHTSTDPARRTMTMRIEAAGGTWLRAAENLAHVSGYASGVPGRTVNMWLKSNGHRRNLLSPDYTHTGVGVAIDPRGRWYVTQLYVRPRAVR